MKSGFITLGELPRKVVGKTYDFILINEEQKLTLAAKCYDAGFSKLERSLELIANTHCYPNYQGILHR